MTEFVDLLVKIWPLLLAAAAAFGLVMRVLWNISSGVATVAQTLVIHSTKHIEHDSKIEKMNEKLYGHDSRLVKIETHMNF